MSQQCADAIRDPGYKRPRDLALVLASVVLLAPVWLLVATVVPLLIWLEDRGPVFFRQPRLGLGGRLFHMYKFRSMVENAETIGAVWTSTHDPRVTKVGRFLRRTGLDEAPQIINVLRGDIGLVGPRPLTAELHRRASKVEPRFPQRLQVRPGGAGLALLRAPRHCTPRRRLRYDLFYIEKASFWLDVRILIATAWLTAMGRWGTGSRSPEEDGA